MGAVPAGRPFEAPASHTHFSGDLPCLSPSVPCCPPPVRTRRALVLGEQPFDVAATAFRLLTTGPEPLSVDGAALGGGLPARRIALSELAAILMHPSCGYATSDRVWRLLIERARTDGPAWVVGAVGVALPGLRPAAYRLRGFSGDVQAELLTAFVAALRTHEAGRCRGWRRGCSAPRSPPPARRCAPTSRARRRRSELPVSAPTAGHPDLVLARAVTAGVITACRGGADRRDPPGGRVGGRLRAAASARRPRRSTRPATAPRNAWSRRSAQACCPTRTQP